MGLGRGQVIHSSFRRKEYIRRKHEGVSNVTEKERILTKSYQSVELNSFRHHSPFLKMVFGDLEIM
jgi:hypothetical protein